MMLKRQLFTFATVAKKVRLGRPGTSLKMGLLGMANIGKSSTFNILTKLNVPAENIPFCTIDPNTAFIPVRDDRFEQLVKLFQPHKVANPVLRIVDIAGLVKGASEGFGLGNQFLSHVMQVDGLYHVVRAFGGEEIAHTEGDMDAARDVEIIRHQLIQKDMQIMSKKVREFEKKAGRSQDKALKEEYDVIKKAYSGLKDNHLQVRNLQWTQRQADFLNRYLLLTSKPMIYLVNLSKEDYLSQKIHNKQKIYSTITCDARYPAKIIPYSVQYEKEIINNTDLNQRSEVANIIKASYDQLELSHFYTVGKDEVRAWAIRTGQTAIEAGGKIHSDFTKGFINAEVMHADALIKNPTHKDNLPKYSRKEGKNYVVKDGDIMHFQTKLK